MWAEAPFFSITLPSPFIKAFHLPGASLGGGSAGWTNHYQEVRCCTMRTKGFTLIELLIVVAIIAILAAIAVPNFLEAQMRSKVSRVNTDQRSVVVAMESYRIDANRYPPHLDDPRDLQVITTPVAYMTSLPRDPFWFAEVNGVEQTGATYRYEDIASIVKPTSEGGYGAGGWWGGYNGTVVTDMVAHGHIFLLDSAGPDRYEDLQYDLLAIYDATNGTKSKGDIYRVGP
jgi:prepilin-type N-terminal cleavage/methylation domain-containing protein